MPTTDETVDRDTDDAVSEADHGAGAPVGDPALPRPRAADRDDDSTDDDDFGNDFVTFEMDGESYALAMSRVQEIIRMPDLVRVPLGPGSLEGLANLRGKVLPVVSLRRCCGLTLTDHDEATRVVVVDASGVALGFVVDRVSAVVTVEADQIDDSADVQTTVRSDLLAGVIRGDAGRMTSILDVEHLVAQEFAGLAGREASVTAGASAWDASSADQQTDERADTLELVSFSVDGQEYALPIDHVQEIVQVPERITPVPNSPAKVLGVMDLRGRLLPVLSLRTVFGMEAADAAPQNRIVVLTVDVAGRRMLVGIMMDTVREVLRVPFDLVGPLPSVAAGGGRTEVLSVCRLDRGRRLVSVLSADALVDAEAVAEALAGSVPEMRSPSDVDGVAAVQDVDFEEDGMHAGASNRTDVEDDGRGDDELLVVFRLADEEYGVGVDAVQEIIRVPESLVRVPKSISFVEGLVNLRGTVLPVVDLRTRLGLDRVSRDERQRIIVLIINGIRTGFVVDSVAEVARVPHAQLEPAPEVSQEQSEVVTRVANLTQSKRMLMVLEPNALLEDDEVGRLNSELAGAVA